MAESSPLAQDLGSVLNRHSAENRSDTPDFILAQYMLDALAAFEKASRAREDWYGHRHAIGGDVPVSPSGEDRIREAMAEAQDHPGRVVTR
jgi:hypothetical protein